MTKNELIELLQKHKGNPTVMIWNGLVQDVQPITGITEELVEKVPFDKYLRSIEFEIRRDRDDWKYELSEEEIKDCKKNWNAMQFEWQPFLTEGYNTRKILVIDPGKSGKTYWDRNGNIEY